MARFRVQPHQGSLTVTSVERLDRSLPWCPQRGTLRDYFVQFSGLGVLLLLVLPDVFFFNLEQTVKITIS